MEIIKTILITAILTGAVGFPIYHWLKHAGIVDNPNTRSSHASPTVRGGGIMIVLSVVVGFLIANVVGSISLTIALVCSLLVLAVVSFFDDLQHLSEWIRFGFQGLAAICFFWLLGWPSLRLELVQSTGIELHALISFPILFLWLVGYTNTFNFMDGINGLAAGQAVVTGVSSAVILGMTIGDWNDSIVQAYAFVAGAALGFLPFNFPSARMFMGDVGSVPLGFILASLVLLSAAKHGWHLLTPLLLVQSNFILDTCITCLRRITKHKWYAPHREHFYQRLIRSGKNHLFVTNCEMGIQFLILLLMIIYVKFNESVAIRIGLIISVLVLWCIFFIYCENQFRKSQDQLSA